MSFAESYYKNIEQGLKLQGIKHIKYTKHGVPLPDWDKILKETMYDENGKLKKVKLKVKVKVKKPHKVSEDLANEVNYKGIVLAHYEVERGPLDILHFFNVSYKGKLYFLVTENIKVLKCIEL